MCSLVNIMYNINMNHVVWGREKYLKPIVASISLIPIGCGYVLGQQYMSVGNTICTQNAIEVFSY